MPGGRRSFAQPSLKRPLCPQAWLFLRVKSNNAELFCFTAACAGRTLAASAAEHACFALIPIGIVSMSIGIRAKSIGIGAFPIGTGAIPIGIGLIPAGIVSMSIGIRAKSIGTGPIPIGIRLIPTGIGLIPAGIVSIPTGIRAIPIDFAPVPIGIGAMQTRFQLPLRAFSRSKAVPQRMTQPSAWLQFLQEFKTEKFSRSSDNPSCCRSQLGLIHGEGEKNATEEPGSLAAAT